MLWLCFYNIHTRYARGVVSCCFISSYVGPVCGEIQSYKFCCVTMNVLNVARGCWCVRRVFPVRVATFLCDTFILVQGEWLFFIRVWSSYHSRKPCFTIFAHTVASTKVVVCSRISINKIHLKTLWFLYSCIYANKRYAKTTRIVVVKKKYFWKIRPYVWILMESFFFLV